MFQVGSGVQPGHLGATQLPEQGLKKATGCSLFRVRAAERRAQSPHWFSRQPETRPLAGQHRLAPSVRSSGLRACSQAELPIFCYFRPRARGPWARLSGSAGGRHGHRGLGMGIRLLPITAPQRCGAGLRGGTAEAVASSPPHHPPRHIWGGGGESSKPGMGERALYAHFVPHCVDDLLLRAEQLGPCRRACTRGSALVVDW
jgi:hypothetical protein